ncbi:alpha/beta hydrolase [Schaedlerella arabinosiphila]|uniref:Alpha/beta hydrolase n=1 Tax=Schaedlerella arabinosiphila TaxID=2044587 RepID=A0A3R8JNF3_9FIRM|nr:alpha/beta hydrolase [Schaedlerella arabinosiphila]RRK32797.1 alpha/beta hydrolase [Schaedlerella arabinosiphila]
MRIVQTVWRDLYNVINNAAKKILKALSFDGIEVEASRHLADLKKLDPMKIFYRTIDQKIYNGSHQVPVRIFFPNERAYEKNQSDPEKILLFLHSGGWVTESIDNYERICARMANATNHFVVSVEYRLAPEHKFPAGLEDCYAAAKAIFSRQFLLNVEPEDITLIGDSAGGNLAAALSLMARDRGEFLPRRQILVYPATYNDYSEHSPFPSVRENGTDYLLTAGKMRDYLDLYAGSEEDRQNPYLAPYLAEDLHDQPDTLILTAEYDPLRDEGEAYGKRLSEAGNHVQVKRIEGALHGFFALGIKHLHVRESFRYINEFLGGNDREAEVGTLAASGQRGKALFGGKQ